MKKALLKIRTKLTRFKNNQMPVYFARSPFMSSVYYILFSSQFRREQHAVLNGKVEHNKLYKEKGSNIFTLIRNTHRLEKGLLMRPRRDVFGLDYLEETVEAFVNIWNPSKYENDMQFKWFYDVLENYFKTSGNNKTVFKNKAVFEKFLLSYSFKSNPSAGFSIPYERQIIQKPKISFEEFYSLTRFRRSVRWFTNEKVPHELVDKAVMAALQSPSACNRQPFTYRMIDEPNLLTKVANLPMGVKGYVEGIPMIIAVVGDLAAYFDERDRHVIYIDASLANMSFMLALETLGLSSCSINWPDIEKLEVQMSRVLNLKKQERVLMLIAVGYPDMTGKVAFSEKRNIDHIRKYN